MQYTENYNLYKPVYGEPADVADLNHNADEIDELIHDNRTMIAPSYDTAVSYVVGDIVEHLGKLYKCIGATTGVWDATKWTQTTLADEIEEGAGGASALDDLTDVDLTTPADGEVLMYDSASGKWVNAEIETATSLEELTDTTITTPTTGEVLTYDDGEWVNAEIPAAEVAKEATGNPIELTDAASAPLVKCVTQITGYQEGSGTPSPDNIRPIVAYTEGEIEVRGKNILDKNAVTNNRRVSGSAGNVYTYNGYCVSNFIKVKPNTTYTKITGGESYFAFYATGGTYISGGAWLDNGIRVSPSNAVYLRIDMRMTNVDIGIVIEGSTISEYEPYTSTTHTTTYPSAIYRGSEDCVNGEVTTEWGMIASYAGETLPGEWISDRDEYAPNTSPTTGAQVAYALATPATSSVTPTNLPIKSLSGYTHIESTTGDMEVEYITKPYEPVIEATDISIEDHGKTIESIITENLEPRMVASRNYTIGELIISGDKAYRATANIASGATLTVGTNVEATTIETELAAASSPVHVYSSTPHKVGTWIDGRDIMEATFHYDQLNSTYHNVKYVGFDIGWVTQANVKLQSDNLWHSAPWLYWDGQNFISVHCQGGNIQIDVGPSGTYATEAYVTINYVMSV